MLGDKLSLMLTEVIQAEKLDEMRNVKSHEDEVKFVYSIIDKIASGEVKSPHMTKKEAMKAIDLIKSISPNDTDSV